MKYSILGFGFIANSQTHKVGGFYSSTDTMGLRLRLRLRLVR